MSVHIPISPRIDHATAFSEDFTPLELWGGVECTVNRVGDQYRDQILETGHEARIDDIDLIGQLGVQSVRMPILWERVAPDHVGQRLWRWSDVRIAKLRELSIRPIAGLLHHGSGPRYTSLLDHDFPVKLADYALSVAQRYRDICDWTPINEPVTTARFSALYGYWYPHRTDEGSFWNALINQIDGTRQAMHAIRSVNPNARLIQTDDLGRTYSTDPLKRQARYNNERRWAGWDMLCGQVVPGHPLWKRICRFGLEGRLRSLADDPCPPDIIGVNHYLTSDRFLDHRIDRYPPSVCGGNRRRAYADVEVVRVMDPAPNGLAVALRETWQRFKIPIAVTEVHLGCTREEQVRWFRDAWATVTQLRQAGHDIRAVTAWALFGNQGWNTLLTAHGAYEPGAFDVRSGIPRKTALASFIEKLGHEQVMHPSARPDGWWRRNIRQLHPPVAHRPLFDDELAAGGRHSPRPILILGATGTLGQALFSACEHRNLAATMTSRREMDLDNPTEMAKSLDKIGPVAVINAAGWVRVDDAETDAKGCFAVNTDGAAVLARLCSERGIATVNFSSDLVFGDTHQSPRDEIASVSPMNVYGQSKAQMEQAVQALPGDHLIVRTAAFFSAFDEHNFAIHALNALRNGEQFKAADDRTVSPTYVPDLCDAVLDLLVDGETGIWHLTNQAPMSWAEFADSIARGSGFDPSLIVPVSSERMDWRAARPGNCALISKKGAPMPSFESALERFVETARVRLLQATDKVACVA